MNKLKPLLALPLLMAVLCLTACGGGEGDTESVPPVVEPPIVIEPPIIEPPVMPVESLVFAVDTQQQVKPEYSSYFVDLREYIGSVDDEPVRIAAVESLSNAPECHLLNINDHGFNIVAQKEAICDYRYRVELVENQQRGRIADDTESATATSRVVISSRLVDFSLAPISEVVADDATVVIDFSLVHGDAAHGVSNFTFILLGEGLVTESQDVGTGAYTIKYTPKLKAYGVHRILYSWEKDTQLVVGYIDIAVGQAALPTIHLAPITLLYDTGAKGNLTETFNFPSEVLALNLTLQEVISMNLVIAPNLGANPSLVITTPNRPGSYYVSYVMKDAKGAQAVGLIKIIYQEDIYPDVLIDRVLMLAPMTQNQADEAEHIYSSVYTDTANTHPPFNARSPLYTWEQANNVCLSRDARLPTVAEISALNSSGKAGNVWPVNGVQYWTADSTVPDSHQAYQLTVSGSAEVKPVNNLVPMALTCAYDTTPLNDTGVTFCSSIPLPGISCMTAAGPFPNQDAHVGRDADALAGTLSKKGGGFGGFDFTKIGANGSPLAIQTNQWSDTGTEAAGTKWSCVLDNVTNLMWEVKLNDSSSIQYYKSTYSWYSPDNNTNGGEAGLINGGSCNGSSCDTLGYTVDINELQLCGFNDWHVPSRSELSTILIFDQMYAPTDRNYFPYRTLYFMTSDTAVYGSVSQPTFTYFTLFFGNQATFNVSDKYSVIISFSNVIMLVRDNK
ncbi:DUF1566 domain-containing protein [Shewanella sp. M16]|uniref:Lcl C-terminal domain-containing protein n=1 Tax=Shewanella sp. M16 TaxID=2830837 RepID=UPI001BAEB67A|nr:DUF1566 domain-containing protein [Shewanella sp. M16]MBS0041137.1 DUF1566 domain-containing protein [Shewanella sp. M16]